MMVNAFAEYGWIILNAGTGGREGGGRGMGSYADAEFSWDFFLFSFC